MKITLASAGRVSVLIATAAFGVAFVAGPAVAGGPSTSVNNADISITGGDAASIGACMNYAKAYAKVKKNPPKVTSCAGISSAVGGGIFLKKVDILVAQDGSGKKKSYNNADIKIAGGDATSMASCANVLNGKASQADYTECTAVSDATGGPVKLDNVTLTVIQNG